MQRVGLQQPVSGQTRYAVRRTSRLVPWFCAAAAGVLMTGCLAVLDPLIPSNRPAPVATPGPAAAAPAISTAAPDEGSATVSAVTAMTRPGPADAHAPGHLYFVIADMAGRYADGWRIQVLAAASQQGFMPFLSASMGAGMYLTAQLWPDSYRVRVLKEKMHYDGWVQIDPEGATVVQVDPSSGAISVLRGDDAEHLLAQLGQPARELRLRQTYQPLRIALHAGLEGRYYGPRQSGTPAGSGRLDLFQGPDRIATVEEAVADGQGRFTGQPVFVDGRKVDGALQQGKGLADGATTEYQDGRVFTGRYEGAEPREGTMRYPDGTSWTGTFEEGEPVGEGRLTLADGTVIEKAPGPDAAQLDGAYDCTMPNGRKMQCLYFEGGRIASKVDYARRTEARQRARAAAEQPPP
ncbi:MAG: hypothetical protein WBF88_17330, partial [Pusillimonas sp.]